MVHVRKIQRSDYPDEPGVELFHDKYCGQFGAIQMLAVQFKFGWSSDLIEPDVVRINEFQYAIGIDQLFAVVDFKSGKPVCVLELESHYFHTMRVADCLIVASELYVRVYKVSSQQIVDEFSLPDVYESAENEDGTLKVRVMDGQRIDIDISAHMKL